MDTAARNSLPWILALTIGLIGSESSALTIYRFGGETLPPPSELSAEGAD